jgi:hypothetical protein
VENKLLVFLTHQQPLLNLALVPIVMDIEEHKIRFLMEQFASFGMYTVLIKQSLLMVIIFPLISQMKDWKTIIVDTLHMVLNQIILGVTQPLVSLNVLLLLRINMI